MFFSQAPFACGAWFNKITWYIGMFRFIADCFGFLFSLDMWLISPSSPTDEWLNRKRENKCQLNKIKKLPTEKRSIFLFKSNLGSILKKKMSENLFSLLSAQERNKCQVATILLNFFLSLHWMGENYPICTPIASYLSDSQRSELYSSSPALLHSISRQYRWIKWRSLIKILAYC